MPPGLTLTLGDLYARLNVKAHAVVQQRISEIKTLIHRIAQDIIVIRQRPAEEVINA